LHRELSHRSLRSLHDHNNAANGTLFLDGTKISMGICLFEMRLTPPSALKLDRSPPEQLGVGGPNDPGPIARLHFTRAPDRIFHTRTGAPRSKGLESHGRW
jgi:hypothetical protein